MPAHDMLNLITRPKLQECQSHSPISSSSHLINGYGANARTQKHRKCSRYIYNRSRLGQSRLNPNRQDCHLRTLVIVWNGHIIQKFYMERFERIPLQWPLRFQSHILLTSLEVPWKRSHVHLQSFLHAITHARPHHKPRTLQNARVTAASGAHLT